MKSSPKVAKRHTVYLFAMLCLVLLCGISGCASVFGTIGMLVHGDQVKPPCDKMKGKVAIVCRPRASSSYQYGDVSVELAKALNAKIAQGIKKPKEVQLIKQQKIEEYCDGMEAESDFEEIGKAVGADQVIAIDLLSFNHIAGTNVWQGKANVNIQLIDVATGEVLFEPDVLDEYVYPHNYQISSSDKNEWVFQREYIKRLANYLSKQFVPYSRFDNDM